MTAKKHVPGRLNVAYDKHPDLPEMGDCVIWRYMDFTKFISILDKSALFFCRADLLGDPFEGSIHPYAMVKAAASENPREKPLPLLDMSVFRRISYISCWHAGESESEAMWKLYAQERSGVAIKARFSSFKDAFGNAGTSMYVSRVKYVDYDTQWIPHGNILLPYLHKRISFKHEEEVRAILLVGDVNKPAPDRGFYCAVDIHKLIQEIVVAPFAEEWFVDLVRSVSRRCGLHDRVRISSLAGTPNFKTAPVG